jgi:Domain of unknown function (DUF5615)
VPLRLYLDDSICTKQLASLLRDAGHEVITPADANLARRNDELHFQFAATHGLTLLTRHVKDIGLLHQENPHHPGILTVTHEPRGELSTEDIVGAIARLDLAGAPVAGAMNWLNEWCQ